MITGFTININDDAGNMFQYSVVRTVHTAAMCDSVGNMMVNFQKASLANQIDDCQAKLAALQTQLAGLG